MKKIILLLALFPFSILAQNNSGMPAGMEDMMEQAQKAQACMENIDRSQLDTFEQEGRKAEAEIKSLCANGNRDQAQEQAIAYSRKMMARPAMKQIRECTEMLRGLMPEMPFDNFEEKYKTQHICDDM